MKLYKDICSAWISRISAEIIFRTDWRQKRLKNKLDLLSLYRKHFYRCSESELFPVELILSTYFFKIHISATFHHTVVVMIILEK